MINCVVYTRIAASVSKKLNLHLLTQEIYLGSVSFRHQIIPKNFFCHLLQCFFIYPRLLGQTQVKCRLLISSIFYAMLEFNLWHFCKVSEIHCIKMLEIKSRHLTWGHNDSNQLISTTIFQNKWCTLWT